MVQLLALYTTLRAMHNAQR